MFRSRPTFSAAVLAGVGSVSSKRSTPAAIELIFVLVILAGALGLRAFGLEHEQLWTDEIISATIAVQSLFDLVITNLRFDAHPLLYHFQLHLWSLISQSTLWLYINSLLWSWVAVLALWRCARDFLAPVAVMVATVIFAVMPIGIEWAHNLRMYGMMAFISILIWFFCHRFFTQEHFQKTGAIIASLLLVMAYSHAAGLLMLAFTGVYSVYIILQHRPDPRRIWWWAKMYAVTGLLMLPAATNLLLRDTRISAPVPTPGVVMRSIAHLVAGPATHYGWVYPFVLVAGIFIVIGFRTDPKIRALLVSFVAAPIVLFILGSFLVQPMWITRMLFLAPPVLAVAAAQGILVTGHSVGSLVGPLARQIAVGCATVLLAAGLGAAALWAAENELKPTNYRAAAEEMRAGINQEDTILIPEAEAFWGVAWYLIGPGWGSPLAVQDTSPESISEKWTEILNWLGPVWRARLHLEPQTRVVSYDQINLIVGLSTSPIVTNAKRVWLVNYGNNRHPYVQLTNFEECHRRKFGAVVLHLLVRSGSADQPHCPAAVP